MAASSTARIDQPQQVDLDKCVHCGLCLNACPTYRELGLEMDSPRGRVQQMVRVAAGEMEIGQSYIEHIDLCLACRGCESACPAGVQYGRLVEAARAHIESEVPRPLGQRLVRGFVFSHLLESRFTLRCGATLLWAYQKLGLQKLVRATGVLRLFGKLGRLEQLTPPAELPTFFREYGKVFPAEGERRFRVAFLGGCIANVSFARLNEASVRVLQKNGCEVTVPDDQTCCGALHLHAGRTTDSRRLARRNIDALLAGDYDAIITNAAGCGSTLKEYGELLADDPEYAESAHQFAGLTKDINEFLASIDLKGGLHPVPFAVTYQDSCHLAHGQKVRTPPRALMNAIPELQLKEMPLSDLCCGSAGVYNVVHNDMSMALLEQKMDNINLTGAQVIATANPGCMLQLRAGVALHGHGQRVLHVVELLDESYRGKSGAQ
ncbi:MAG: 4Fe-4S dicluster domain-containing protein [bacterium]|nr:4Fe-4S dicluster domain-containing protein [bacterium]